MAAVLLVMGLFFTVTTAVLLKAAPMVVSQVSNFSGAIRGVFSSISDEAQSQSAFVRWNPTVVAKPDTGDQFDKFLGKYKTYLDRAEIPSSRAELIKKYVEPNQKKIGDGVKGFFGSFLNLLGGAAAKMFLLLFTPIFVLLILKDMESMKMKSVSWIPPSIRKETVGLLQDVGEVFISYLRGVTTSIMIYTCLSAVVLGVLGIKYFILLALLFGSVYVIPYLGGVMILTTIFLVTWLTGTKDSFIGLHAGDPMTYAIYVTGIYTVFHFGYDNLLNPMFVGKSVGLNPLVSMFVIFCGGALFGLVGMIISYPIAGVVKVVLQRLLRITGTATKETVQLPAVPLRHRS